MKLQARPGGALVPVLILTTIMVMLSAMLPQVLVSASGAMRNDDTRDRLQEALDSGVATAEARLQQRVTDDLVAGIPVRTAGFAIAPTLQNPDYGRTKRYTFGVRVAPLQALGVEHLGNLDRYTFGYGLAARAELVGKRAVAAPVTGRLTVGLNLAHGAGGVIARSLGPVKLERMSGLTTDAPAAWRSRR